MTPARGTRPSLQAAQDRGTRSFAVALALAVGIALVEALVGANPVLIDLLVVPPLLAAAAAGRSRTAIVGAVSVALATPLALLADDFEAAHLVSILTVALSAVLAVWVAVLRERREKDSVRLGIQYAVARVLADARSVEEAAPKLLEAVGSPLGWEVGALWRRRSPAALVCISSWAAAGVEASEFQRISEGLELERGTGLPGRVLESGEPAWIANVLADENFPRAPYAARAALRGALAFPVRAGSEVDAVIEFFARRIAQPDAELTSFMTTVAAQVGEFIEARRSEDALRAERKRAQQERERLLELEQVARLGAMQAREQLEAILGGVADGVTAQATDGRLVFANAAAVKTLGFESAADLLASPVPEVTDRFEVFDEEGQPFPMERLPGRRALAGEPAEALVRFRVRATGEERWSLVKANPVFDQEGDVVMAINVMEDITEPKRSELREQFLSEASRVLASSLDGEQTLRQVAMLSVPDIADWCAIDLLAPDGSVERVTVAHSDPAQVERAERLRDRYPPDDSIDRGVPRVLRTGESELYPEIPEELLEDVAQDAEHLALLREFGFRSAMVVPMVGRGRTIGAVTFVSGRSGRRFDEHDLQLAEELARRCAGALENARLFGERDYIAKTLQQSLLPAELPQIPGLETAARFRAAGEGHEVGGDFYDLFQTREHGWSLVVGDVCGKGPDAAAVTALARYTLRAAAMRERSPSRILALLNEALLRQRRDRRFCTVAYAQIEVDQDRVRVGSTSGGHPLPLVRRADGSMHRLGEAGTLLGVVEDPQLRDSAETLGPGDVLVFYTDGVTEARDGGAPFGELRLVDLVRSCSGLDAETIAARIEAAALDAHGGAARDDIAVVTVRVEPQSPAWVGSAQAGTG